MIDLKGRGKEKYGENLNKIILTHVFILYLTYRSHNAVMFYWFMLVHAFYDTPRCLLYSGRFSIVLINLFSPLI